MKISKIIAAIASLGFIVLFCFVAIYSKIYPLTDLQLQFMGAFMGAIITTVIGIILPKAQSNAKKIKRRKDKISKKKSQLYENYIERLNQIIKKQSIEINEFEDIKSEFHSRIVLYLKENFQKKITCCFEDIAYCVETPVNNNFETDEERNKIFDKLRENLTKIINLLTEDLGLKGRIDINLVMNTERKLFPKIFRTTLLQEVINCFPKEEKLIVKSGFYDEYEDGVYIVLILQGENSQAGEIHIGPFVNRDMKGILLASKRLHFRVKAPQFNPVADLYTLQYGNDNENCFISLENKKAQYEYEEKYYIDLSLPLNDDAFEDSELDRGMYNKFIYPFSIEDSIKDSGELYSRYHGIYLDVCKAIAKRAYHYFRKTYAISQEGKSCIHIKDLCLEIGRVTEREINEYIAEKQGFSLNDSEEDEDN